MKFHADVIREVATKITQLGLNECPVCKSTSTLAASHTPVILPTGDAPWSDGARVGPRPGANILFMIRVTCDMCGHVLLFDSERFHDGDTPVFVRE